MEGKDLRDVKDIKDIKDEHGQTWIGVLLSGW